MKTLTSIVILLALSATATANAAPDSAKPAAAAASMPADCGKGAKPHDHGAERGTRAPAGTPRKADMSCDGAKPAADAPARTKPAHDHGRMHKQQ